MSSSESSSRRSTRVAAIYARVSSERQRQAETIQSQLAALRELAGGRELLVSDDLVFEDDGFSGATLIRPALERLRDRAAEGAFEVLLCHAPDRLARRYAYQVLLLEELARAGVEVIFAKEPERSGSPEDELLRQFQGMISEYERAQIAERTRRGTLHRARAGAVAVLSRAPYGYRYIRKSEHTDAFLEIDECQAQIVREIFDRYARGSESVGAIARALSERAVPTRTGATGWSQSTIWGMLRNPAYAGQAAYGKTRMTEKRARLTRTTRQRGERHGGQACERVGSEQWIHIPVPALIDEQTFALVAERLERGKRLSPRNTRQPSLLQGILVCAGCGYAYYRSQTTTRQGRVYHYYRCSGTDGSRRLHGQVCGNRPARLEELDELVWSEVLRLLEDPALIQAEIQRRLESLRVEHPASHRREGLERDLVRARRAVERLIEAYQEELISLDELRARSPGLRKREATLQAELDALNAELHDAESYLKLTETLESFRARLGANAQELTIEQRQQVVRLLVREVLIDENQITIRHSIPAPQGHQPSSSSLRSGGQREERQEGSRAQDRHERCRVAVGRGRARDGPPELRAAGADPRAQGADALPQDSDRRASIRGPALGEGPPRRGDQADFGCLKGPDPVRARDGRGADLWRARRREAGRAGERQDAPQDPRAGRGADRPLRLSPRRRLRADPRPSRFPQRLDRRPDRADRRAHGCI
ncbi:MAG TPA: recombinase family protein [Solirubrobacteraceae bacterium]|nr:recombinase family protein [Solirubrobacteraceae bacterium]